MNFNQNGYLIKSIILIRQIQVEYHTYSVSNVDN